MWLLWFLCVASSSLVCCLGAHRNKEPNTVPGRSVIVHLFEWRFDDIADECETFLGPRGYGAVQTSPVNEHGIILGDVVRRPWYERYQPVSYKIKNRSGNESQFRDMVRRCNQAGVRVYIDVVINHMTGGLQMNKGTAGSIFNYAEFSYPAVPYGPEDFNRKEHCGTSSGTIESYGDANQVRNCELVGLRDLNMGREHVRAKVADYLNRLIDFGVAGFRVDAAKHMWPHDLEAIYDRLKDLSTEFFPADTKPFIYQEVIDLGHGEPVTRWHYRHLGRITEFMYGAKLGTWRQIYNLVELHNVAGFMPVSNWWDNGYHAIAFGRGNATFIAINNEDFRLDAVLQTSLPPGRYCDVISGSKTSTGCSGRVIDVRNDGKVDLTVDNAWEDPMVALHIHAKI
ncbi:hypothetical protein V5799_005755 [Amblyomma americanum]|uniref:Alpha-amylase n=1 Tax=Amblyomma americanum TaxID=6943 RepID=A0AAQ4DYC4_AMBAM